MGLGVQKALLKAGQAVVGGLIVSWPKGQPLLLSLAMKPSKLSLKRN